MHPLPPRIVAVDPSSPLRSGCGWGGRRRCSRGRGGDGCGRRYTSRLPAGGRTRQHVRRGGVHVALRSDCLGCRACWLRAGPQYRRVSTCQLLKLGQLRKLWAGALRVADATHPWESIEWSRDKRQALTNSPSHPHVLRSAGWPGRSSKGGGLEHGILQATVEYPSETSTYLQGLELGMGLTTASGAEARNLAMTWS